MNGARAANEGTIARRLCHKKWLMLHFLSLQRNNRLNALAMDSANGKNGEKDCILHHTVEMKQSHSMTEPARLMLPGASHRGCPATEFFMLRTVFSGLDVPVLLLGMVFCLGDE